MNKNYQLRDQIVFTGNVPDYNDIKHFTHLSLLQLQQLIDLDFIELTECQNNSPTTQEIFNFMAKYPQYTAHGYVVTIKRPDYRITLEGVEKFRGLSSTQEATDFYKLFSNADALEVTDNNIYCWYD